MAIRRKLLQCIGILSVGLAYLPTQSVHGQETDFANYVIINEHLSINPEALESDIDMTTLPYYSYGELNPDDLIERVESYFDSETFSETIFVEMDSESDYRVAPHYELEGTDYKFTLNTSRNAATQADTIFFNLYKTLGGPYSSTLPNYFIDAYHDFEDVMPLTNPELDFMSPDDAEVLISDTVEQLFHIEAVDIEMRSMDEAEMQVYIDYQNVNKVKPDTPGYTGDVGEVYFGKIIPQIEGYPIHVADQTGMNDHTEALQGTFAITNEGIEYIEFLPYTPIGEKQGNYEETISYEEVVDTVTDKFTSDLKNSSSHSQKPYQMYIRSISVVYMPVDQRDLGTAGYFPMWQVDYSVDGELVDTAFHMFVNPLNGDIY